MRKTTLLIFASSLICQAEPIRFEEANFSIDVPAAWKKAETPPQALALFRSPDNSKGVTFMTMRFSPEDAPTALEKMVSGAKGGAQKSNVPVTGEHERVIDGVTFSVHSLTMPGNVSVISSMAVAGERGYSIQGFSGVSDAATDPEIVAMLESFKLLSKPSAPATALPAVDRSAKGQAYQFGEFMGRLAVIAFGVGAIILTGVKAFKRSKKPA